MGGRIQIQITYLLVYRLGKGNCLLLFVYSFIRSIDGLTTLHRISSRLIFNACMHPFLLFS